MEEPWPRLVVRPGLVQRPQRVRQAAGDHADPHAGQLHGGHQLRVLVGGSALQREETDTMRGLHVDQRALLQLIVQGRALPKTTTATATGPPTGLDGGVITWTVQDWTSRSSINIQG